MFTLTGMKSRHSLFFSKQFLLLLLLVSCIHSCRHKWKVSQSSGTFTSVNDSITYHESSEKFIQPYRDSLDKTMNRIIGFSENNLTTEQPEGNLGNFVCDLMLDTLSNTMPDGKLNRDNCFCLMNAKGLRAPLPKGEIPLKRVFEIMPFENEAVIVKLSQEKIIALSENIASAGGHPISSNVKMKIRNGKCEMFSVNGKSDKSTYWVITSDYLANGGDNMTFFKEADTLINTGYKIRDMIKDRIELLYKQGKQVNATIDGRVEKL